MKGLKLCKLYSVLLSVFFSVILSFLAFSQVNALEHKITNIPIYYPSSNYAFPNYYQSDNGFIIETSDEITSDDFLFNPYVLSYYKLGLEQNNRCTQISPVDKSYHKLLYNISGHKFGYSFNGLNNPNPSSSNYCMKINGFAENSFDDYDVNHVQDGLLRQELNQILPYRSPTSAFFISDPYNDPDTGIHHDSKMDFVTDLFKPDKHPEEIKSLTIPIGQANNISFSNYDHLVFSGDLFLIVDADPNSIDFDMTTNLQLETRFISNDFSGSRTYTSNCSTVLNPSSEEDALPTDFILGYSCVYDLPGSYINNQSPYFDPASEFPWFRLKFDFSYTGQDKKLYMLIYEKSILTTNHDHTKGQDYSVPATGSYPHSAPGGHSQFGDPSGSNDPNWFDSLVNLFSFNFLNPFAPLFSLFTDNSQCVSIPVIAGLLNSEETTYCPWFDSDIRNIVTPVVGLSSTMLLFGFLVRWLGARSGNLFADDLNADNIDNWQGIQAGKSFGVGKFRRKH